MRRDRRRLSPALSWDDVYEGHQHGFLRQHGSPTHSRVPGPSDPGFGQLAVYPSLRKGRRRRLLRLREGVQKILR